MKTAKILIIAICLLIPISSLAFDGKRKGFVFGGGFGFAPFSKWKSDITTTDGSPGTNSESKAGFALNFLIGGAFDEHNMLVYEGNFTGYNSDYFNQSLAQGFNGAAWYYYFGSAGKSVFTALGLGFYDFKVNGRNRPDPGLAILLGAGYEFTRHWQVGGYLSLGKTSDNEYRNRADLKHSQFSFLVNAIAF